MGLLSQDVKFRIFCNSRKSISHNIMQGHPFLTMTTTKNMDPHKIQRLATKVMWHPKDQRMGKTQPNVQQGGKNIQN
jgi:hypothetical protein